MNDSEQVWERTRDGHTERVHVPMQPSPYGGYNRVALVAEELMADVLGAGGWHRISDTVEEPDA